MTLKKYLKGDPVIWFIVFALSVLSVLVVYSATGTLAYKRMEGDTEYYLYKHAFLVILCLLAMWVAHLIDYRYYAKLSLVALYISVPLLVLSLFIGDRINDATRWITIPLINQSFQPSDFAKLALFAHLANMLSKRQQNIHDVKDSLFPMLAWCGIICTLIGFSNFSNAILLFITCLVLLFVGRVPIKYFFVLAVIGIVSVTISLYAGQRLETAKSRIKKFLDPQEIPFQAEQSYIAIANGGILGKGPGNSDQKNYLPHPYSDFIFAIIIEEYGLFGGVFVLFLYLGLLYRGMMIMATSERAFGGLLSAGLSLSLVMQAMANMCVAVGLVPITGLPLPLLSMGGTSLLFTGLCIGIILSVSRGDTFELKSSMGNMQNA